MNLAGENDTVTVKSLAGPLIMNGGDGNDELLVSSDKEKLSLIDALLVFDGGDDSYDDILTLDNSGDTNLDDELYLTRLIAQVDSMKPPELDPYDNETNPDKKRTHTLTRYRQQSPSRNLPPRTPQIHPRKPRTDTPRRP